MLLKWYMYHQILKKLFGNNVMSRERVLNVTDGFLNVCNIAKNGIVNRPIAKGRQGTQAPIIKHHDQVIVW